MAETSKFHSSLAITNVKTLIPITLDLESGQYHSWVALFKVHVKVHNVLEHIIPPTDAKENVVYDKAKVYDLPLLKRLNAAVLQWIYATVSSDILTSILIDDDSTEHAWHSVADLFHDNKNSRALYLNKAFTNISILIPLPVSVKNKNSHFSNTTMQHPINRHKPIHIPFQHNAQHKHHFPIRPIIQNPNRAHFPIIPQIQKF